MSQMNGASQMATLVPVAGARAGCALTRLAVYRVVTCQVEKYRVATYRVAAYQVAVYRAVMYWAVTYLGSKLVTVGAVAMYSDNHDACKLASNLVHAASVAATLWRALAMKA